jgi:hypothetical protein
MDLKRHRAIVRSMYRVGIYSGGEALDTVYGLKGSYGWLAAAGGWAGFQGYQNYDIKQFRQSTTTFGGRLSILAKRLNLNSANGAQ